MENSQKVVVRFPPSPTGFLQMGNVRTLIYNYLFARQNGGQFLLRIEDTDKERSKKEYEDAIFDDIKWLGIDYDNKQEVWRSSQRTEIYKQKLHELINKGHAYISQETEGKNKEVIRFKNPGGKVKFQDLIRGEIEIDVSDLGDFIIARNINDPLYHVAVSIDDAEAGMTHVIRGDDHISNTPRQILIIEALGGQRPIYAHLPMVLAPDKSKLSKRKHGEAVSLRYYKDRGYVPEAIVNFLAMVGWNPGTDQEIFSLEELIKTFDLSKVQKKGAIFNVEKLDWLNREYILRLSDEDKFSIFNLEFSKTKWKEHEKGKNREFLEKLSKILLDRIHRSGEVSEAINSGEFDYLFEKPVLEKEKIMWKGQDPEEAKILLHELTKILEGDTDLNKIKIKIMDLAEGKARPPSLRSGVSGRGSVLWPLRYALSGRERSPDPFTLIDILGIKESKERIMKAMEILT